VFARSPGRWGGLAQREGLDIGSGTGFYVDQWHRLGVARVTGVDITDKAVEELAGAGPVTSSCARMSAGAGPRPASTTRLDRLRHGCLFHLVDDAQYAQAW
jgi:hypothetical protein